jgi:DNA invertase Pin-like site-specific DNA recombinase
MGSFRHKMPLRGLACSVDTLGRSLQDLVGFLSELHALRIDLFLHRQGLDTTTPAGKALFQMMGVFAEFERELIRARTSEGRARAKARGVHMGRPPKLTVHQRQEALGRRAGIETLTDIARSYNVSHATISRL